jgi:hypothetical protein
MAYVNRNGELLLTCDLAAKGGTFQDVAITMYSHSKYAISSIDENNGVVKCPYRHRGHRGGVYRYRAQSNQEYHPPFMEINYLHHSPIIVLMIFPKLDYPTVEKVAETEKQETFPNNRPHRNE